MSGPKISIYEISPWQRKNLREQLKCTQNSFACAEQIKQLIAGLNGLGGQIVTLLDTLSFVNARTGDCTDEFNEIRSIQKCFAQDCSTFVEELSANMPVLTDKIIISEYELNAKKVLLANLKLTQSNARSYHKRIEQTLSDISGKAQAGVVEVKSGIADDISTVSSFHIEPDDDTRERFADLYKELEHKLSSLYVSRECPPSIKNEILEAISALRNVADIEYLNTFNAITVIPLLIKYDAILARQEQGDAFDDLKARYSALCVVAQIEQKSFSTDNAGIESLASEIAAIEKQIVAQTEQAYISDCVNEVMTEMGYNIIGDRTVTKRSGKRFRNELFYYGDGTAINVTYDSEGQIAMELGGIDRTDRVPTSDETDALCEEMESFCSDFKVFEERLEAKGVSIRSRVSMLPPAAEYAAIINVDDYTSEKTFPMSFSRRFCAKINNITTDMPDITIKNKRKKSNAKQMLRREGN